MKKYLTTPNIILVVVLIIVSTWRAGNVMAGIGAAIFNFFIGIIVGLVITGLFMFVYNIFRPDNKIELGIPVRITAGLIGAILIAFNA